MKSTTKNQVTMMDLLGPLDCSLQALVSAYPRMTLLQMKVFTSIASGQTTVSQVAKSTGCKGSSIYKTVDTLSIGKNLTLSHGLGLVHYAIDTTDAHRRVLSLTPKGLAVASDMVSALKRSQSTEIQAPTPSQPKTHINSIKWLVGALSSWSLFGSGS
jgi:DNA-binding MarR family transcriptional regulator